MAILPFQKPEESVVILPQEKKQKRLFYILVVVALATVLVLYFGFFAPQEPVPAPVLAPGILPGQISPAQKETTSLEGVELDFSLFDDLKFQALQSFGQKPDISGERGRTNPFLPY